VVFPELQNVQFTQKKSVQEIISHSKTIAIFNEKSDAVTFKRVHQVSIAFEKQIAAIGTEYESLKFVPNEAIMISNFDDQDKVSNDVLNRKTINSDGKLNFNCGQAANKCINNQFLMEPTTDENLKILLYTFSYDNFLNENINLKAAKLTDNLIHDFSEVPHHTRLIDGFDNLDNSEIFDDICKNDKKAINVVHHEQRPRLK
jgi:hypothetical protein